VVVAVEFDLWSFPGAIFSAMYPSETTRSFFVGEWIPGTRLTVSEGNMAENI